MTKPTNNVLEFPKDRIVRDTMSMPEVLKVKAQGLKNYADSLVTEITDGMLEELNNCGIDITDSTFVRDFCCVSALVRATVYRAFEFEHPCHIWMDSRQYQIEEKDDEPT